MLLEILAVVVLALVLFALARKLRGRAPVDAPEAEEPPQSELIDALRARTGDRSADALAGEERYEEAIHALLLDAFSVIVSRDHRLARPDLTSRELAAEASLAGEAEAQLMTLVRAVELCVFARRQADRALYEAAKRAHDTLMPALRARPAQVPARSGDAIDEGAM